MITQEQVEVLRRLHKFMQSQVPEVAISGRIAAKYQQDADALAAAIATIEGLPQHADTGNYFVAGLDPAWIMPERAAEPRMALAAVGGEHPEVGVVWVMLETDGNVTNAQPYSTAAAARGEVEGG